MRSFWRHGLDGKNVEGYIDEISHSFQNCKMWEFNWKDMKVLMVINQLNSSNKEEAHLTEKLMESYNMSKVNKKALEMEEIRKIISDFWTKVKERK